LLLDLASIDILGFRSLREIDQDFFLLDMYVLGEWGLLFDEVRGRSFEGRRVS
jgi:hypothetical protein